MNDAAIAEPNPREHIGGNLPPSPRDELNAAVAERIKTANEWARTVPEITDLGTAQACDDFIAQLRAEGDAVEAARKAEKQPHDDAITEIQGFYTRLYNTAKGSVSLIGEAIKILNARKATWLAREDERLRAEERKRQAEADRKREEAEALAAAADSGEGDVIENSVAAETAQKEAADAQRLADAAAKAKPKVRGEVASRASGFRTLWKARITDQLKALRYYRNHGKIKEALQGLADADARAIKTGAPPPGVEFYSERTV